MQQVESVARELTRHTATLNGEELHAIAYVRASQWKFNEWAIADGRDTRDRDEWRCVVSRPMVGHNRPFVGFQ